MSKQAIALIILAAATFLMLVPRRPSAPAGEIAWRTDADVALKQATADGKPTLMVFSAAWCGACQAMREQTWPSPQVASAAKGYNTIWVDIDNYREIAQRYQIDSVPTVIRLDDKLNEESRSGGFVDPGELVSFLRK
jgi:thiol:disulfide interchange protein DsbD